MEETTDLTLPGGQIGDAPRSSASAPAASAPDASDSLPGDRVDVPPAPQNVEPGGRTHLEPIGRSESEGYVVHAIQRIREAVDPDALARNPDPEELGD